MPNSAVFDVTSFDTMDFPYDRIENELSDKPRLVRGLNMYTTRRGKLARRPGTNPLSVGSFDFRVDRQWIYETEETPQRVYSVFSAFNHTTNYWELWYQRLSSPTPGPITKFTSIRGCNKSLAPHEGVVARGKFYCKSFCAAADDLYGSLIFDGSDGIPKFQFWGVPKPTQPARIVGILDYLNGTINNSTTSIVIVGPDTFPAAPFVVQIDNEQMNVTAKAGLTFTVTRGYNNTTAAAHADKSAVVYRNGWATSDHNVQVNLTWRYVYCFESITGQVSSRSSLEADPRKLPSATGPFLNLIPKLTLHGHADTTNIPNIRIYRTTDGGGKLFYLDSVPNPGAIDFTYEDKYLAERLGTTGFNDPVSDDELSNATAIICPTTTSNDPPPPNVSPNIPGVDEIQYSSPLTYYAGRIWYSIGTNLLFSGNEEITDGVPEECWPSGSKGNFFKIKDLGVNVRATSDSLYVATTNQSYNVTGQTLDSFNLRPIFDNVGSVPGNPRAITRYGNTVATLTHDFRVALIEGENEPKTMSDPLFTDLVDASGRGGEFQIEYWADLEKSWLFVCSHRIDDPQYSQQWVLDVSKTREKSQPFWFVPWGMRCTNVCSGRISEGSVQRRLIVFFWDEIAKKGFFSRLDPTARTAQDYHWDGYTNYDMYFTTHLVKVPAGNHVNGVNLDARTPTLNSIMIDRSIFSSTETDGYAYVYLDDFWTSAVSLDIATDPARREQSIAYKTMIFQVNQVGERVAFELRHINDADLCEYQNIAFLWDPEAGD